MNGIMVQAGLLAVNNFYVPAVLVVVESGLPLAAEDRDE